MGLEAIFKKDLRDKSNAIKNARVAGDKLELSRLGLYLTRDGNIITAEALNGVLTEQNQYQLFAYLAECNLYLQRGNAMRRIQEAYEFIDSELSEFERSCHKGCSSCCKDDINILIPEAKRLKKMQPIANNTPLCPFLNNNACGIYDDRPLTCRHHITASSPSLCMIDSPEVQSIVTEQTAIVMTACVVTFDIVAMSEVR